MEHAPDRSLPRQVGRYTLHGEIASGGMATVHFGLLNGPVGFRRTVAIKKLHDSLARDPEFVAQFLDEARLAARIRHPNVVQTLDVVTEQRELLLVMEYVDGETLGKLMKATLAQKARLPIDVAVGVMAGALHGLHAAHEATTEHGEPLGIVHRDVSPQNIVVGRDGVPRVLDFGVAKATARIHSTRSGQIKGKLGYMSPEQVSAAAVDRRTDVFAAAIVLWEALTGERLFARLDDEAASIIHRVLNHEIEPPRRIRPEIPEALERVVMRALERDMAARYRTASEFAVALEEVVQVPSALVLGRWVASVGGEALAERADTVQRIERDGFDNTPSFTGKHATVSSEEEKTRIDAPAPTDGSGQTAVGAWTASHKVQRRRNAALGIALAALLVAAFVLGVVVRGVGEPLAASASVQASAAQAAAPTTAPAPSAAAPPTSAAPTSDGSATAPSAAPSTSAAAASSAKAPRQAAARKPALVPNCNPPYTLDAEGIRHPKPGCY